MNRISGQRLSCQPFFRCLFSFLLWSVGENAFWAAIFNIYQSWYPVLTIHPWAAHTWCTWCLSAQQPASRDWCCKFVSATWRLVLVCLDAVDHVVIIGYLVVWSGFYFFYFFIRKATGRKASNANSPLAPWWIGSLCISCCSASVLRHPAVAPSNMTNSTSAQERRPTPPFLPPPPPPTPPSHTPAAPCSTDTYTARVCVCVLWWPRAANPPWKQKHYKAAKNCSQFF